MNPMISKTLAVMFSGLVLANPVNTCNCTCNSTYLGKVAESVEEIKPSKENNSIKVEQIEDVEKFEIEEKEKLPEKISLGKFKLTAYCSCEKCCGSYAKNRPVDEYGNKIVYGSSGQVLKE